MIHPEINDTNNFVLGGQTMRKLIAGLVFLAVSPFSQASDTMAPQGASPELSTQSRESVPSNASAKTWLNLQASGSHAGSEHPISGEVARLSYARYLNSFKHPIPMFYEENMGYGVAGK